MRYVTGLITIPPRLAGQKGFVTGPYLTDVIGPYLTDVIGPYLTDVIGPYLKDVIVPYLADVIAGVAKCLCSFLAPTVQ